ncbi:MAG: hypothetical protein L6R40_001243 [Gallowayella cf. fulva]|nr:MAG: hypothetical protein L6R40_001243 [Xanthomendoza cf. fulva]
MVRSRRKAKVIPALPKEHPANDPSAQRHILAQGRKGRKLVARMRRGVKHDPAISKS